jgi:hypothetical protein
MTTVKSAVSVIRYSGKVWELETDHKGLLIFLFLELAAVL